MFNALRTFSGEQETQVRDPVDKDTICYSYTRLHEVHPQFRRLEPLLPFLDVYLCSTIEEIEVLLREMELDPRTNKLEKRQ